MFHSLHCDIVGAKQSDTILLALIKQSGQS